MATARSRAPAAVRSVRRHPVWLLTLAVLLLAVNLRTAVTSIGPLLEETRHGLHLSGLEAGLLTTLPVICFAVLGAVTPPVARRIGEHVTVAGGLVLMTAGLAGRALAASGAVFLVLSVLALAGGAIGNVVLPALVKRHFPDRVGPMTAAYTTALAVGTTAGAALSVPAAQLTGRGVDWRAGLGIWAVFAAVGVLPWLALLRESRPARGEVSHQSVRVLLRSRTAWWLTLFFGTQSAQAYVAFGWFAQFFRERGISAERAGLLVAVLASLAIPASAVIPAMAARMRSQRPLIALLVALSVLGYAGMLVAPVGGAWLWVVLVGLGAGAFPLSLTLLALRTRTPAVTAALSAFVQSIGYVIAGSGPLLVGVLHRGSGDWAPSFVLLYVLVAVMALAGWFVGGGGHVEDELAG